MLFFSIYHKAHTYTITESDYEINIFFVLQTAVDISEFNITSLFHEIATNEKYELPKAESAENSEERKQTVQLEGMSLLISILSHSSHYA